MTTEQQAREAFEKAACEAFGLTSAGVRNHAFARRVFDGTEIYSNHGMEWGWRLWQHAMNQAAEDKRIADAVRGADAAFVHDDNEIVHTDDCDPKHYGRVLIIPRSVLEGE